MINFDEEIQKFQPSLEVEDAEDTIYNNDVPQLSVTANHFVNGDEIIVYVPEGSVLHYNDVGVR